MKMHLIPSAILGLFSTLLASLTLPAAALGQDAFADEVTSFAPGINGGFGAGLLPEVVLGPPLGEGESQGSLDVVSLGNDGEIVLRFTGTVICDGAGADFTVFENAFLSGTTVFAEVGIVSVSQDGANFIEFPYDAQTFAGLAGKTPVYSHPSNGIDPTDPTVSGGDSFDLQDVGLPWAAYVRITDPGATIPDPGNGLPAVNNAGFDLDAIAAIHDCDAGAGGPTPSSTPTSTSPTATPTVTATATSSPVGSCSTTPDTDCKLSEKSLLQLNSDKDRFRLKWLKGDETTPQELGDPTLGTVYTLCFYDADDGSPSLVSEISTLSGGRWQGTRAGGFKYTDRPGTAGGLTHILLKPGDDGKAKLIVQDKGPNLDLPPLPMKQEPEVVVQLRNSEGHCWSASFSSPAEASDDTIFEDRFP